MLCPFCKEEIKEGAIKCKHCGSMIDAEFPSATTPVPGRWVMAGWQAVAIALVSLLLLGQLHSFTSMYVVILLTAGCLLLWIVVFPWYLCFRSRVLAGVADPIGTNAKVPDEYINAEIDSERR